jgi:hypothetical protein
MDWIEKVFHLAPDGGSGSLEVSIVAGAAVALALVIASAIKLGPAVKHWVTLFTSQRRRSDRTAVNRSGS